MSRGPGALRPSATVGVLCPLSLHPGASPGRDRGRPLPGTKHRGQGPGGERSRAGGCTRLASLPGTRACESPGNPAPPAGARAPSMGWALGGSGSSLPAAGQRLGRYPGEVRKRAQGQEAEAGLRGSSACPHANAEAGPRAPAGPVTGSTAARQGASPGRLRAQAPQGPCWVPHPALKQPALWAPRGRRRSGQPAWHS